MLLLTNLLVVFVPFLFSRMIAKLEAPSIDVPALRILLASVLAVALASALVRIASRLLIFNTGRTIEYELRTALFDHMQRMPASVFDRRPTGDLVSRATNDLGSVRLMFGFGLLNLVNTPILFLLAIGMMLYIDPRLTPAVIVIYPLVIFGVRGYARRMFDMTQQVQGSLGEISATAQESFSAVQVIKSYTLEEHRLAKVRELSQRYMSRSIKLALTRNVVFNLMTAVIGLSELILLAYGGWEIMNGRLTKGELVAFNVYLGMMVWPTMAFGFILSVWQRGMAAMSRIEEVLAEPEEAPVLVTEPEETWRDPSFWRGDLEVRGLSWGYGREDAGGDGDGTASGQGALRDVSLRVAGGQFTALIGPTGCGKTTLARLLTRLHNPPTGTIFVNGTDLTAIPLETLRRNLSLSTQESFLFSRTLSENIAFGRPDAGQGEVVSAAEFAELVRDLEEFPRGYETPVGERGITLSGGQRQRTAIARLLVYDPPIVIFDDSLSAVDLKTEEKILSHLRSQLTGRTVLLITHRIATASAAQRIYVMDGGRIVEEGTHEALLAGAGLYARLAEIQQLSEAWEIAV